MPRCCASRAGRSTYPGGAARVAQAVDVDLLARAIAWSGEAAAARNEAFNVTNGDVFTWENIWPAIADALGMKPGKPCRCRWRRNIRTGSRRGTRCGASTIWFRPGLKRFVGLSFQYADYSMRYGQTQSGPPSIVSTVKINQAGFTEMMDTEDDVPQMVQQAGSGCCRSRSACL